VEPGRLRLLDQSNPEGDRIVTDQELIALVMDEGRAYLATTRNAEHYDEEPTEELRVAGRRLLREWNAARMKLRAAVLSRLAVEEAS
jgi:fibrillarin-like rRNA methylase